MPFPMAERHLSRENDPALPISPLSESSAERKRVRQHAHQFDDGSSDSEVDRKRRRVKPRRTSPTPASMQDLPVVEVPVELLDPRSPEMVKKFSPGAIIAMRLVDFQVARDATYRFEPHLNMILGSNGSGKSTVVTAIFLLFQGRLRDLERSAYSDFITFGKERAVISAVIRAREHSVHVIAMVISSAKGPRTQPPQWFVDGSAVSDAEFSTFVAGHHIQVNNLSQFLPQSRIASFAGLSPEDRLKSIEEAVGYDGMLDDHNLLSTRGQELVEIHRDIVLYQERLNSLRERKADLDERINLLGNVHREKGHLEFLNQVLKLAEYREIESELNKLSETLESAREGLRSFDSRHARVTAEIKKADARISELALLAQTMADDFATVEREFEDQRAHDRSIREELKRRVTMLVELRRERDECARRIDETVKEHRESQLEMARSRKQLNDIGDAELFAQQENKLHDLQKQQEVVVRRRRELLDQEQRLQSNVATLEARLQRFEGQLRQLETAQNTARPLHQIRQILPWDRGSLEKAVLFVRHHRDKFRLQVIDPAIVSVSITDDRLPPMIARVIPVSHMLKFVCQCREDLETLTHLGAKEGVGIKATLVEQSSTLPQQALHALKKASFEGVLSDGFTGPAPMLNFLRSLPIGRTPYSFSETSEAARKQLRAAYPIFSGFVDTRMHYSFSQSKYGSRLETETSQKVGQAAEWAGFMLRRDTSSDVLRVKHQIGEHQLQKSERHSGLELVRASLADTAKEENIFRSEMVELSSKVKIIEKARLRLSRSTRCEKESSAKLQELKTKRREYAEEGARLVNELINVISGVTKRKLTYEEINRMLQNSHKRSLLNTRKRDVENKRAFLSAALDAKRTLCSSLVDKLSSELAGRHHATREQHKASEEATSWLRTKRKLAEGVKLAAEKPTADLQTEIGRRQSLLNMRDAQGESLAAVQQKLRNVISEIQDLERRLSATESRRDIVSSEIELTRKKWEQELEQMVATSSSNFAAMFFQLGCQGAVRISKPDPFAVGTWGLDVYVAFREHEEMQKLSRNRQSGGERSVTTAVYLMSLQRMTRAPFRVLDEINQGMDKHNETKTMAFIVDHSCNRIEENRAQQYFLITPKLLFNMPYHRRMSVNFIISSDQIERPEALPLPSMAQEDLVKLLEEEAHSD